MSRARLWTTLAMGALVGLCGSGLAMAQDATPPAPPAGGGTAQRGDRQRPTAADMQQRMEEWRKRAADQLRQSLGASEDEWKVLQPRIEKVQSLQRSSRGGMMGRGGFSGMGGMGGPGTFGGRTRGSRGSRDANTPAASTTATPPAPTNPDGTPRELTAVEKTTTALNDVMKNKDASPTQITEALTALRAARTKGQQELTQARKSLQEVVTPGQEAKLVLMGVLE